MNVEILFFWRHAICFVYPFCWVANSTLNDAGKKNLLHTSFSKLLTIYFLFLLLWCTFSNMFICLFFFCKMSHHPHLSFCFSIVEMTYVVPHFGFEVVCLCRKRKMLAKALLWHFFLSRLIPVDSTLGEEPLTIIAPPIMILRTSSLLVFFFGWVWRSINYLEI